MGVAARRNGDEAPDEEHDERFKKAILRSVEDALTEPFPHRREQLAKQLACRDSSMLQPSPGRNE